MVRNLWLLLIILLAFALRVAQLDSLPLSLSFDEAPNGLDALHLVRTARLTPFLQNQFGRETLFFYLQGAALQVYGVSSFSLRFVSALTGTFVIPLLYAVSQRVGLATLLLPHASRPPNQIELGSDAHWLGLLAATGLAVSYWHIFFSRLALRANLLLPLLLAAIYCFWRGWFGKQRQYTWLILSGALLGLTAYTYIAARLLPLLFGLFFIGDFLHNKSSHIKPLIKFSIFGGVALLVAGPLIFYFLQNPQAFYGRTSAISIFAEDDISLMVARNLFSLMHLYFLAETWLGQWPALNFVSVVGLLVGLAVCVYRLKRLRAFFLLLWLGLGSLPVLFSVQIWERQTTMLRGIVAWPAIFLISALGLLQLVRYLSQMLSTRHALPIPLPGLMLGCLLFWGSLNSVYHYFLVEATAHHQTDDRPTYLADYLNSQTEQVTLIPLSLYTKPVLNFLLQSHYSRWTDLEIDQLPELLEKAGRAVYLLPDDYPVDDPFFVLLVPAANGQGTAYNLPVLSSSQFDQLLDEAQKSEPISRVWGGGTELVARVFPLSTGASFLPDTAWAGQPLYVSFGDEVRLTGHEVRPASVAPGETATLVLTWQAQRPLESNYFIFIHLFDVTNRQRWGQINTNLRAASIWPVGTTVPQAYRFTLPNDAPSGPYRFEVGLYHFASLERAPVLDPGGQSVSDRVILGKLQVQSQPPPAPTHPLADLQFSEQIRLSGIGLPDPTLQPGGNLNYSLHWQALAPITDSYTVFTHLLNDQDTIVASQDNLPQQGRYPTNWWSPHEIVIDPYTLALPADLPPGQYSLRVGLYLLETGQRLKLKDREQDFVDLLIPLSRE